MNRLLTRGLLILFFLGSAGSLFADCQDVVLRMRDPLNSSEGGREITAFFNCHTGSVDHPDATTVHFFEWKQGKLCQTIRTCGNVRSWYGAFSIGAVFSFGNLLSPFKNSAGSRNRFLGLAGGVVDLVGGIHGRGRTENPDPSFNQNNTCIDATHGDIQIMGSAKEPFLECAPRSLFEGMTGGPSDFELQAQAKFVCAKEIKNVFTTVEFENHIYKACHNASFYNRPGAIRPYGNMPVRHRHHGSFNTDYRDNAFYVDFVASFQSIRNYCEQPQAETCF